MKFLDLFAGIGGFRSGLEANGHEAVGFVEIDKFARKSYEAMYDTEGEWTRTDITKVTNEEFAELKGKVDIITGGFPCFAKDTLITTSNGLKPVQDIQTGDMVLTHKNRFKEVVEPMVKQKEGVFKLEVTGSPETFVTEEHPYYVRELVDSWDSYRPVKELSRPKWVEAKDLTENHFIGFSENKGTNEIAKETAWFTGKTIASSGRASFDDEIQSLSKKHLKQVVDAFLNTKGKVIDGVTYVDVDTKQEVLELGQAVQKAYEEPYDIHHIGDKYTLSFQRGGNTFAEGVYDLGMLWMPIKNIEYLSDWDGKVYNFEVADDNSYVANNTTVHNCQSFSIAGKRLGFADETRGTLFFDIIRAAEMIEPKILFLENVKGLVSHDGGNTVKVMLNVLTELGYDVDFEVFNSKYFNVPQNRERIFIVATKNHEKDWSLKDIIEENPTVNKRLKEVLDDEVEDKFYLEDAKIEKILSEWLTYNSKDRNYVQVSREAIKDLDKNRRIYNGESIAPTLLANSSPAKIIVEKEPAQAGKHLSLTGEPKLSVVGNTSRTHHNSHNVYHSEGLAPTLTARDFKGPKQVAYQKGDTYEIRKLTPLETWRLQGFTDEQFAKSQEVNSNTQLYKQSGNSVTVNVIKEIAAKF